MPAQAKTVRAFRPSAALQRRLARVRLFLCDVDGVLTEATVTMNGRDEAKTFHIQDGLGLRLLQRCGIRVGWVSNRPSPATTQRAADLKVDFLYQDSAPKVAAVESILTQAGCAWADVCYLGDDIVDLGVLRRAGLAVAVPDALAEVRACAHYVTRRPGGRGAAREVVELILRAQNHWTKLVEEFSR